MGELKGVILARTAPRFSPLHGVRDRGHDRELRARERASEVLLKVLEVNSHIEDKIKGEFLTA